MLDSDVEAGRVSRFSVSEILEAVGGHLISGWMLVGERFALPSSVDF
jgi:hypothetical protein